MKTVKVRIAVLVDPKGAWAAYGGNGISDATAMDNCLDGVGDNDARFWLTAELPVPEAQEIAATVEEAKP